MGIPVRYTRLGSRAYPHGVETEERVDPLAWHHTRLVSWIVYRFAFALLLGTLVGLVVGGIAWQAGSVGWVVASPAIGLLAMGGVLAWWSTAPSP